MSAGNVARVVAVLVACVAAVGSSTSRSSSNQDPAFAGPGSQASPPPPQQMEAVHALGLWRSTFGAVKIEPDNSKGGVDSGSLHGVWVYQRQGQEVIGYFAGSLRGNVLQFRWQEPQPGGPASGLPREINELTGEGYLVFDVQGRQYSGRWWSDKRDRVGEWNGWRQANGQGPRQSLETASPYGEGAGERQPPPGPYQRRSYRQPQPYQPQAQPQPQPVAQPQPQAEPKYF